MKWTDESSLCFFFFINVSWLTSVCKWGTLICSPCSRVILYFFPWLKRTFLMWHPPSAHINTRAHAREFEGGVQVGTHTHTGKDKHSNTALWLQTNNSICACPLKDTASMSQLTQRYQMAAHRNHINTSFYFDIHLTVNCYESPAKYPSNVEGGNNSMQF